ncbi:hypothetical protein [Chitinophaga caeni]|nr:hypothetical protein [Chitinophaga caeni]
MKRIYNVNISLQELKYEARRQHTNIDSIQVLFQSIENRRDSLYRIIIADSVLFSTYKRKKVQLVSIE